MKYKKFDYATGYEIIGYAMLGEDFGIKYSYEEYNAEIEIPNLNDEEILKTYCMVREYR